MKSWEEIRVWRKAERAALIERRVAVRHEVRAGWDDAITAQLPPHLSGAPMIGFYWPFKAEYDPRALARSLHAQGTRLALPVVIEKGAPLIFREWWPGKKMTPGVWNIPIPADGEPAQPNLLLVPLVGFDREKYRLGYGGGFYDRTLAAMNPRPRTVGIGFEMSLLETIYPQPHDMKLDLIVTEQRVM